MVEQSPHSKADGSNGTKIAVIDIPQSAHGSKSTKENVRIQPKKSCAQHLQPYVTMFIAEVIGTGLLMFLGCMGCVGSYDQPPSSHHFGAITFGLVVMLIIQTFGHISGAHLNPAVTIATVLCGILNPVMAVTYIIAQFIGATLGFGLLKLLVPEKYVPDGFCVTDLDPEITLMQGLGIEIVITTVLILICCSVWDKRNETKVDSVPLRFGFAIAAISMAAGPLTGASMNTARSFAPLIFGGTWENQWIYWIGPNIAAFIACAIYRLFFKLPETGELQKQEHVYLNEASHVEKL